MADIIYLPDERVLAAFSAAATAKTDDLRGMYPMAARVLCQEVYRLRDWIEYVYDRATDGNEHEVPQLLREALASPDCEEIVP